MITKESYVTANFIDNERKNIEILLKDGDITRPHIIEADENNSDYKALLKIVTVDELHEQTHNAKKAEGDAFKELAIQIAKDSGLVQQEIENRSTFPALVDALFNNVENEDDMFALKLALFEVASIRDSKTAALKTKLRKSKTKFDILRCGFEIVEAASLKKKG
jgi:hypothetical protein